MINATKFAQWISDWMRAGIVEKTAYTAIHESIQ